MDPKPILGALGAIYFNDRYFHKASLEKSGCRVISRDNSDKEKLRLGDKLLLGSASFKGIRAEPSTITENESQMWKLQAVARR